MKVVAALFACLGIAAGMLANGRTEVWTIAVTGDLHGYLSPCGCTSPMMGGIRRRAAAIEALGPNRVLLDNGGFVNGTDKQSLFKAQAAAEAIAASGVAAINISAADAALGKGAILSVAQLSDHRLVSTQFPHDNDLDVLPWIQKGPFLIGGVTTDSEAIGTGLGIDLAPLSSAVDDLLEQARKNGSKAALMLSGSLDRAKEIAQSHPDLALIVYSATGDPPTEPLHSGNTVLVTAADRGRHLTSIKFDGEFRSYRTQLLTPEIDDDPAVTAIYQTYLKRVDGANLIDLWPRFKTDPYAGSETCVSCHAEAAEIWKRSGHHHALATLEEDGHGRDPDCVVCHVTGLSSTDGFRTRETTPTLADVGCESCHGPGKEHSVQPKLRQMAKVGEQACVPCHTVENSPNFDFKTYWARIKH
jgi:hypothetical protein